MVAGLGFEPRLDVSPRTRSKIGSGPRTEQGSGSGEPPTHQKTLVAGPGFEPRFPGSEPGCLPLADPALI